MLNMFDKVNFHIFDKVILCWPLLDRDFFFAIYRFMFHQTNTYPTEKTGYFFISFMIKKENLIIYNHKKYFLEYQQP